MEIKLHSLAVISIGPKSDFATEDKAGSAPCDLENYYAQISRLKNEGYVVIATFQHYEVYVYMFDEAFQTEFLEAAKAGADIDSRVSSSLSDGI